MPTTDVTNTLIANITSTEQSTSNVPINRSTGNPAFAANVGQLMTYFTIPFPGAQVIPLPISPCTQVYIRNIDPTHNISISWTPNGGGAQNGPILYPGDQLILWSSVGANPGITGLSFVASGAGTLVEYFLGG